MYFPSQLEFLGIISLVLSFTRALEDTRNQRNAKIWPKFLSSSSVPPVWSCRWYVNSFTMFCYAMYDCEFLHKDLGGIYVKDKRYYVNYIM
jgi:hypothetical protein